MGENNTPTALKGCGVKKAVESIALKLQVIYSMAKCSYYAVNYGATALKICYDTDHQKVGEQHISQKLL